MARSASSRETYAEPFLRTSAAKIMLAAIVLPLLGWGIFKLERINERHQVELRLERDPTLGSLVGKWRSSVANNQRAKQLPGDQLPVALYFGTVMEYVESKPAFGLAPTCVLKLQNPQLLAGSAHKTDTREKVEISFKPPAPKAKPFKGQELLVVVWRDSSGNNIVHTVYPCTPQKP